MSLAALKFEGLSYFCTWSWRQFIPNILVISPTCDLFLGYSRFINHSVVCCTFYKPTFQITQHGLGYIKFCLWQQMERPLIACSITSADAAKKNLGEWHFLSEECSRTPLQGLSRCTGVWINFSNYIIQVSQNVPVGYSICFDKNQLPFTGLESLFCSFIAFFFERMWLELGEDGIWQRFYR